MSRFLWKHKHFVHLGANRPHFFFTSFTVFVVHKGSYKKKTKHPIITTVITSAFVAHFQNNWQRLETDLNDFSALIIKQNMVLFNLVLLLPINTVGWRSHKQTLETGEICQTQNHKRT